MSTAGASGGAAGVSGDTGGSGSIACVTGGEIHYGEAGEMDGQ